MILAQTQSSYQIHGTLVCLESIHTSGFINKLDVTVAIPGLVSWYGCCRHFLQCEQGTASVHGPRVGISLVAVASIATRRGILGHLRT